MLYRYFITIKAAVFKKRYIQFQIAPVAAVRDSGMYPVHIPAAGGDNFSKKNASESKHLVDVSRLVDVTRPNRLRGASSSISASNFV